MPRLTIIGIGSPFADDRAGWSVVETLVLSKQVASYGENVVVTVCSSPASELLSLLMNTNIAVIVDAIRYCGAPGTIYRLTDIDSPLPVMKVLSSHGIDLRSMCALAETLGQSPGIMIYYGIEAGSDSESGLEMCQSVGRAVARVAELIRRDVENYFPIE
jgi:hydrogenase maturation protease